ncbi:MAG: thiamine pyrophosphate-dependent enzyme [Desulfatiglans sp.]|jgi:phenylglyoxylate dehydrogenase beta subunit|nr:thiamine pyrophosphate-dependent enzyme [Thermodesulfobacteriota bacterium]MEE4354650.1 thiamine pyrophosphate-dependent enzyme [Desulfatiglans sp.]
MVDAKERGRAKQIQYLEAERKTMQGFYGTLISKYASCGPDCHLCEDACAKAKEDGKGSRIKTVHLSEVGFHGVLKCNQCSEPGCAEVCPTGAIYRNIEDGIVRINQEKCVGCGLCTMGCPYGGVHYDVAQKKAFKCDKCDGDPKCAEACEEDVLTYGDGRHLFESLGDEIQSHGVLTCQGCGEELGTRMALRTLGEDVIIFGGPGCSVVTFMGTTMGSQVKVPTMVGCMTNLPSIAAGVSRYFRKVGKNATLVVFAGDGMASDVGFQSLSGAAERGENIIYICLDNEGYMNTGAQRSGTSPYKSWTSTTPVGKYARGKRQKPKYLPLIMAFHGVSYVATASVSFPEDYTKKLLKAKTIKDGMAYIHLLCPCPTGWHSPSDRTIEIGKMAVETNYFPLWEAERGKFRFTHLPKSPKPVGEFTSLMGRFSHLTDEELEDIQESVNSRFDAVKYLTEREVS